MEDRTDKVVSVVADLAGQRLTESPHLTTDELAAYLAGMDSDDAARDQVQGHLAICRECSDLVLALPVPLDVEAKEPEIVISEEQMAAAFAKVRGRVAREGRAAEEPRGGRAAEEPRGGRAAEEPRGGRAAEEPRGGRQPGAVVDIASWRPPKREIVAWALAASFLIATGISLWWTQTTPITLQGNVHLVHLFPVDEAVRSAENAFPEQIPSAAASCVLVLNFVGAGDFASYEIEAAPSLDENKVLWMVRGLIKTASHNLTVQVPISALKPEYQVHLFGVTEGERTLLATYEMPFATD